MFKSGFLSRFAKNDRGSASVEFVLWFPFFWLILAFITDATLLLQAQSRLYDVARDSSRLVSTGTLTESQAEIFAEAKFTNTPSIHAVVATAPSEVTTTVSAQIGDVLIFGDFIFPSGVLSASISMLRETSLLPAT